MAEQERKQNEGDTTVEKAGHKGGQRVKELVEEGKQEERTEHTGHEERSDQEERKSRS